MEGQYNTVMRQAPKRRRLRQDDATEEKFFLPEEGRLERGRGAGAQRLSAHAFLAMLLYHHFSINAFLWKTLVRTASGTIAP